MKKGKKKNPFAGRKSMRIPKRPGVPVPPMPMEKMEKSRGVC